ncbi:carbonic anhydrase [Woodsholea maritima]|uniref:carbonic anhydrase n=1 Tax=Woodsholea maritima TaxID=240237 RepID=UPI00036A0D86|nr:carbonic anhydrase family protein [Woodsholea maritima]
MKLALSLALVMFGSSLAYGDEWGYHGAHGPEHWGEISAEFAVCSAGHQQSPVDLHNAHAGDGHMPELHWTGGDHLQVANNGHTAQVNTPAGSSLVLDGVTYNLIQFHFHHMSEHTVDGHAYPLEVHFVHAAENGNLAVVGVFFEEGAENAELAKIWSAIPGDVGSHDIDGAIDYTAFLPSDHAGYRYQGSLTTPPCSEIVSWTVMSHALEASHDQIEAFAHIFHENARPVQDLHGREVFMGH